MRRPTRRDVLRQLLLAAAAAPLAAGCSRHPASGGPGSPTTGPDTADPPTSATGAGQGTPDRAAEVVADLATTLHGRLPAQAAGNLVWSPLSVVAPLAMLRPGARGTTAQELDHVLRTTPDRPPGPDLHTLRDALAARVAPNPSLGPSAPQLTLESADSVWGRPDVAWSPDFTGQLRRDFGTAVQPADFPADPEAARRTINDWTAARTHQRITELLGPGTITGDTVMVLVDAVYFRAPWANPFTTTRQAPFTRADGSRVDVPMMTGPAEPMRYGTGPGWQAAALPYGEGDLAMAIVLPDSPAGLPALLRTATGSGQALRTLLSGLTPQPVQVFLPRWTFRSRLDLTGPLTAAGMPTAFDRDRADFSGMAPASAGRLFVSAVLHQAFIAVDEHGTEAAAATAGVVGATAAPADPAVVVADRPFLFVIHDVATATPLFVGTVGDPTAG
jgi:serpin B